MNVVARSKGRMFWSTFSEVLKKKKKKKKPTPFSQDPIAGAGNEVSLITFFLLWALFATSDVFKSILRHSICHS